MRLFKLLVTLVILAFIGLFIYQNLQTWTQPISFKLNVYFFQTNPDKPPSLDLYPVILISAFLGFIIGLAVMLRPHFKTRRQLKRERQEKKTLQEELTARQVKTESPSVVASPSLQADQAGGAEKDS